MRWPIYRKYQVIRRRIDPITGRKTVIREAPPAPAARLFWTRFNADIEAIRLNVTVSGLRRGTEGYEVAFRK